MTAAISDVPRRWAEALNCVDLDVADTTFALDCRVHISASPDVLVGPIAFKEYVRVFLTAFPDGHFTIEDQVAVHDKVALRWHATGTHMRALPGIPPTGKAVSVHGISIDRIQEGRIVERWELWDEASMLRQIGVVPHA